MPRKKRNYHAEYLRKKQLAQQRGYRGPKEQTRARKTLGLTRGWATPERSILPPHVLEVLTGGRMRRLRQECKDWSDLHSHSKRSRYSARMSNRQVEDFWYAYVQHPNTYTDVKSRRGKSKEKSRRIARYVKKWTEITEAIWKQEYPPQYYPGA